MKDAVGELNMTVITVIAIAAIAALFYVFVWPMIQRQIVNQTCKSIGIEFVAVEDTSGDSGNNRNKAWLCCPEGETAGSSNCVPAE